MATSQHHSPVATAYATSLLDLATDGKTVDPVASDLRGLRQIVQDNPTFKAFLSDPSISEEERGSVLKRVFGGRIQQLVLNFLGVLNVKGRLGILSEIVSTYDALLDERLGKVEVDVTVAEKLTADQVEQVRKRVSDALGKQAVIHTYVDPDIIGGLILRVGDKLIDASVRHQLRAMREQLIKAKKSGQWPVASGR